MLQDGQQSTMMAIPMPHQPVIMTQMRVREKKGNEALLKELKQWLSKTMKEWVFKPNGC